MQALGRTLSIVVHLKIDAAVAVLEGAGSDDDLFPGYFKIVHIDCNALRALLYFCIIVKVAWG